MTSVDPDVLAALLRSGAQALEKLPLLVEQLAASIESERAAVAAVRRACAPPEAVWFWQGGGDHPESLSCPVVMSPEQLRAFVAAAEFERRIRAMAGNHPSWGLVLYEVARAVDSDMGKAGPP